jgi:hypothetical protein
VTSADKMENHHQVMINGDGSLSHMIHAFRASLVAGGFSTDALQFSHIPFDPEAL